MIWLSLLEKSIWFAFAALGFAILFNVPARTLLATCLIAATAGFTKFLCIDYYGLNVIMAAFLGASVVGILSIPAAHHKHTPPMIFSIPAVIPLIPGVFIYRTILGLIQLTDNKAMLTPNLVPGTFNYGLKALFIIMGIATGVGVPMLITRKESAKDIRIRKAKHTG